MHWGLADWPVNNWDALCGAERRSVLPQKKRRSTIQTLARSTWFRLILLISRKITDKFGTATPKTPNVVPADGALSAAVDVMSFTHDIVMLNDSTIGVANTKSIDYKDPLRELVLLSVDGTAKPDKSYASALAQEAAILGHVKEVHLDTCATDTKLKPILRAPVVSVVPPAEVGLSNLTTVFKDPKDIVDPEKEREFLQMLRAIEESDSEGLNGDHPVLGKVSLIRRAKSAVSRTCAEQPQINDKHPLFHVAWDKPKLTPQSNENESDAYSMNEDAEEGASSEANDNDAPTVEEVKRHMELFHLRRSIPPPSAKLKEAQSGKYAKQRRPKTAKYNKYGNFAQFRPIHNSCSIVLNKFAEFHRRMRVPRLPNRKVIAFVRLKWFWVESSVARIHRPIHWSHGAPKIWRIWTNYWMPKCRRRRNDANRRWINFNICITYKFEFTLFTCHIVHRLIAARIALKIHFSQFSSRKSKIQPKNSANRME